MAFLSGARLGPYEIVGPAGAGGMGQVYKARDTRLNRIVAIKVLPDHAVSDRSARERFEREARAISALSHPHICTLYDVGVQDATDFLVMEYVDGETVANRLEKGPMPIEQALTYAIQMASALDRAHRAGIVHRDIKPGNVMLTRGGVKLLDFGLAMPAVPTTNRLGGTTDTSGLTQSGMVFGTVPYMAPEQLEGRTMDARTDIFAFGALLYEMISGRRAFDAPSGASVIAAILEREPPPLSSLQPLTPPALERIVSTCLEKNPDERWQSARDLLRALQWTVDGNDSKPTVPGTPRSQSSRTTAAIAGAAAAAAAVLTAAILLWRGTVTSAPAASDVRFSIYPEHGSVFATTPASVVAPQFALSPDGSHLAFVATAGGRAMLWVRPLNALHARLLPGTEDADYPFWSPDSRSIGFFAQGKLKTLNLSGGAVIVRTNASRDPRGAAWSGDGRILAALMSFGNIMTVSPQGQAEPALLVARDKGEANHRWPSILPDGRHFLYVVRSSNSTTRGVTLAAFGDERGTRLVESDHAAAFADGRLFFVRGSSLLAQPLDIANRRMTGEPMVLFEDVGTNTTGFVAFSISRSGALAYASPWPATGELTWFGRDGRQSGTPVAAAADYVAFSLSPDGRRLALSRVDAQTSTPDIWLLDLARGANERLTFDPLTDANAFWSPEGARIVFRSNRTGVNRIYIKGVNDSRSEELVGSDIQEQEIANMILTDFSSDGAHLLLTNTGRATSFDIWSVTTVSPRRLTAIANSEFDEYQAVFSPDGRWIAFVSNESGTPQVYVQSFPDLKQRFQVSSQGGTEPQWRRDGQELFYLSPDQTLMAVPLSMKPVFTRGLPVPLFRVRLPVTENPYRQQYLVSPDGQRFLLNKAVDTTPPAIHVILNLRALLATSSQ